MLFLIRGKLQIKWDLTFNSMYELIILLAYLYYYIIKVYRVSLAISAIHKNSISNQMGVVDGRAYRVTRLVTCKKDAYLWFLAPRAFIWYPTRPTLGWWWRPVVPHQIRVWLLGVVTMWLKMPYEHVFIIPDIESLRLVPHMTNIIEYLKIPKFSHDPYGRGPEMALLHIGWRGKLRRYFWRPIWAPWKWNCRVGNYFPKSSFLCTNWLGY